MGIFQEMITVYNRAPVALTVRFDGQQIEIPPGATSIPKVVAEFAKNQNPIMGSQDADNPNVSGAEYLIGIVGRRGENCEPLTAEEWETHLGKPCRVNTDEMFEGLLDTKERVFVRGRKKPKASAIEAFAGVNREFGDQT